MIDYGQSSETFIGSDNFWPLLIAGISAIASHAANKRQQQKNADSVDANSRDRAALDSYLAGVGSSQKRLSNAVHADKIRNYEPVKANWGGPGSGLRGEKVNYTGGYANPNMLSAETKKLSSDLIAEELRRGGPPRPTAKAQKSNWLDKVLGGVAIGSSVLSAANNARNPKPIQYGQNYANPEDFG